MQDGLVWMRCRVACWDFPLFFLFFKAGSHCIKRDAGVVKAYYLFVLQFVYRQPLRVFEIVEIAFACVFWNLELGIIMSGCGNANCKCGASCTCKDCSCGRTMAVPSFGGLRNYYEPDCKCGPDCKCADCDCHKGK